MPRKYRKKITVTLYHTEGFFVCAVWLLKKSKVEEVQILVHFFFNFFQFCLVVKNMYRNKRTFYLAFRFLVFLLK